MEVATSMIVREGEVMTASGKRGEGVEWWLMVERR